MLLLKQKRSDLMRQIYFLIGLVLIFSACSKKPVYPEAPFDGSSIRIEQADVPDKKPLFFTFTVNTRRINFFLLKINGDIESYFDACSKCFPKKMGFRHENNRIICRACNVGYNLDDLKEGIGSCYPIKLNSRVEGTTYVIDRKDILVGEKYF